jgi:hypothetical protein
MCTSRHDMWSSSPFKGNRHFLCCVKKKIHKIFLNLFHTRHKKVNFPWNLACIHIMSTYTRQIFFQMILKFWNVFSGTNSICSQVQNWFSESNSSLSWSPLCLHFGLWSPGSCSVMTRFAPSSPWSLGVLLCRWSESGASSLSPNDEGVDLVVPRPSRVGKKRPRMMTSRLREDRRRLQICWLKDGAVEMMRRRVLAPRWRLQREASLGTQL